MFGGGEEGKGEGKGGKTGMDYMYHRIQDGVEIVVVA